MDKSRSKLFLFVLTVMVAFALCVFALTTGVGSAKASEPSSLSDLTSVQMLHGAYVRILSVDESEAKDSNGIKFGFSMSGEEYTALIDSPKYEKLTFGIMIAPTHYLTEGHEFTVENLFGKDAIYDWATYVDGHWINPLFTNKVRIINIYDYSMVEKGDDYVFYGSVLNIKDNNLSLNFTARGYIIGETSSGKEYLMVDYYEGDIDNNTRKISNIAESALNDSLLSQDEKDWIEENYVHPSSRLSFHPADKIIPNGAKIGDYITWPTATNGGTLTVQISYGTVAQSQNDVTIQSSYAVGNTNMTVGDNRWVYFATWTATNEYGSETYVQKFYVAKVAVQEFEINTPADVTLDENAELVENISEFGVGNSDYCVKLTGNTATITLNYDITTTGANNQTASLLVVNRGTGTAKVHIYNNAKTYVTTVNMTGEVNSERTIIPFGKNRGNDKYISDGKLTVKVEIECSDGTPEIYLGYFAIGNDCTIEAENGIEIASYTKIVKSISSYSLPACTSGTVEVSVYDETDKENVTVDGNSILPKDKHTYSVTYSLVSNPLATKTIELYFLDLREILLEDYSENDEADGETLYTVPACTNGDVVISVFDVTAGESVSMESATTFIPVPCHTYEITYVFSNNENKTKTITVAFADGRVSKLSFHPADKVIPNGAIIGDYLTWPTATNGGTLTVQISYGTVAGSQNAVTIAGSYGVNKTGQTVGDNRWVYFATWTAANEYGSETYVQKFYVAKVAVQEFEIDTPADVTLDGNAELVENISEFGAGNSDYCVKLTGNTATITLNYDITTTGANNQTASLLVVNRGTGTAKVNIYNNAKTSVTTVNMTGEVNSERTIIPFGKTRGNSNYISGGKLTVKVEIECSDGTPEIYLGYFAIGNDCTISRSVS